MKSFRTLLNETMEFSPKRSKNFKAEDSKNQTIIRQHMKTRNPSPEETRSIYHVEELGNKSNPGHVARVNEYIHRNKIVNKDIHAYIPLTQSLHHNFEHGEETTTIPINKHERAYSASTPYHRPEYEDPSYHRYLSKSTQASLDKEPVSHQLKIHIPSNSDVAPVPSNQTFNGGVPGHEFSRSAKEKAGRISGGYVGEHHILIPPGHHIVVSKTPTIHTQYHGMGMHQTVSKHVTWHGHLEPNE